jgi:hypothetical protein
MASEKHTEIHVFCSYSEDDRSFQEKLERHLASLVREGSVLVWGKHKIRAGQEHQLEIDAQLKQARLILLLISSNFISSDDCYAGDLMKALQRRHDENVCVIPILLKPCTWDGLAFSNLQILPRNGKPVSLWPNQDKAFTHIVEEIKLVVKDLHKYGATYMEPLQPKPGVSAPSRSSQSPTASQRSRIPQAASRRQTPRGTKGKNQTNILMEEAILPAKPKYVKPLPRSRFPSVGSTLASFLTFFFANLSGHAFERRCKRWKGNSAFLLFFFALIDLFLLPYIVYLRSHAQNVTGAIGLLSLLLFLIGVFNEENAIGLPIALIYFPIWIAMGEWYLNGYMGVGLSQLFLLILILLMTLGRLLLFLWRSPFEKR